MDKQLLKAYIRTIVEEEVKRVLPELLSEAVREVKQITETTSPAKKTASGVDRKRLAEMLGVSFDGDTIRATTQNLIVPDGAPKDANPDILKIINKDYSQLMKKMGIT
jgi:hypothetical protein